jgi:hypothetical protein
MYAPLYIETNMGILEGNYAIFENWQTIGDMIHLGNDSNSNSFLNNTVRNIRVRPMVAAPGIAAVSSNSAGAVVEGIQTRSGPSAFGTEYFDYLVKDYNDQAMKVSRVDLSGSSAWGRCDATFCSSVIYGPGPFATNAGLIWFEKSNLSLNCRGNGITMLNGNTLHVSDVVIQGFNQWGVKTGTVAGGFGPSTFDNVYEEVGNCSNPQYTAAGATGLAARAMAGVLVQGNSVYFHGGEAPNGQVPVFACSGTAGNTQFNYWVIVRDSVMGPSAPLYAGRTPTTCSGTVSGMHQRVAGTNTVTYDYIHKAAAFNALAPAGERHNQQSEWNQMLSR